jgi:hypothetical protein
MPIPAKDLQTDLIEEGEVALWPAGNGFCIVFGLRCSISINSISNTIVQPCQFVGYGADKCLVQNCSNFD